MAKKIQLYGLMIALAFIISYLEMLIPINLPGLKLGLSNIVILIALYNFGVKAGFIVSLVRIALVGLTFGNLYTAIYSFAGCILSLVVMAFLKKIGFFSVIGVSMVGGTMHNLGQFFCAMLFLNFPVSFSYISFLIIAGTLTGAFVGFVSLGISKRLRYFTID